jgi:Tfp pilus assembly PilM family ATPase
VAIPNSYFKIFELPTDKNLTKNDLDEYIKWEISKLFPAKGKDYFSFNKIIIDSLNYKSVKTVLVYAIPTFLLKRIHKFCHRNSLKLSLIDNSHTSVIPLIQADSNLKNILSVHIENNMIAVLLMRDGKINAYNRKAIINISEIHHLIKNMIEELRDRKLLTENIDRVYASGNSFNTELKKNIEHKNNISIIELNPFNNFEISENLKNNKFTLENKSKFITAASLALRKLS